MKRQQRTIGAIFEINIDNQYHVYGQILEKANYAFFDYKAKYKLSEFSILEKVPVLFILAVYNDVITQGHWLKVGKLSIRDDLKILPMKFIQDALHPAIFELYNPNTGEITPTKKDQIEGLECAAVWDSNHVEDRIRDHYNGVPNVWANQLRIK